MKRKSNAPHGADLTHNEWIMKKAQVILLPSKGEPDPQRLLWALRGVCRSLNEFDMASLDYAKSVHASELAIAAALLSDQLVERVEFYTDPAASTSDEGNVSGG